MPHRRDEAPVSSRSGQRVGYTFATTAALVRERFPFERAQKLTSDWSRYVEARRRGGKSPQSTAEHIARFERLRLARPPARDDGFSVDPLAVAAVLEQAERAAREGRHVEAQALADQARWLRAESRERGARSHTASDPPARRRSRPRPDAGAERIAPTGVSYKGCPRGTRLQAILFPKARYSALDARRWAKTRGFVLRTFEETPNFVRVQLVPSGLFQKGSFRNILLSEKHGVRGIIGCPRLEVSGTSTRRGVRGVDARRFGRVMEEGRRRRVA